MFDLDAVSVSTQDRSGAGRWLGEVVATLGLVARDLRHACARVAAGPVAYAVGGYIAAAYWFTSSTSFANPAVTVARMFSDTFAGIAPASVPALRRSCSSSAALLAVAPGPRCSTPTTEEAR